MSERLGRAALGRLPAGMAPGYDPAGRGAGIVHIGVGAFHRAHQAAYADAALAAGPGDWRIDGINLRSAGIADALAAQDGLYTLVERGSNDRARVIGSIRRAIPAARDPRAALEALAAPGVRVVTLTVTEKAYGLDRAARGIDPEHPAIAADLARPRAPAGAIGMLVEALRLRRAAGSAPFAVLCCDNLPENGALLRGAALEYAGRLDPRLAAHIEAEVAFPSSMVDRITPAPTEATRALAARLTGFADAAAVETEPFSQWVIEDDFPQGRPAWEAGGALLVSDVVPFERMKLRMLNGAHTLIASLAVPLGHRLVRDAMADAPLASLARRHIAAAARTLGPLPGINLAAYGEDVAARFANPAIAHETRQIAMDGTEKLPQRIAAPALDALAAGDAARPFAFALAAWARYCLGRTEAGDPYELRDPREGAIRAALMAAGGDPREIMRGLLALPEVFPLRLAAEDAFVRSAASIFDAMLSDGLRAAMATESAGAP